jgi:hypothetical protein
MVAASAANISTLIYVTDHESLRHVNPSQRQRNIWIVYSSLVTGSKMQCDASGPYVSDMFLTYMGMNFNLCEELREVVDRT